MGNRGACPCKSLVQTGRRNGNIGQKGQAELGIDEMALGEVKIGIRELDEHLRKQTHILDCD